jgi:hypothetical protein
VFFSFVTICLAAVGVLFQRGAGAWDRSRIRVLALLLKAARFRLGASENPGETRGANSAGGPGSSKVRESPDRFSRTLGDSGRQPAGQSSFSRGISVVPDRIRGVFIKSAGEPKSLIGPIWPENSIQTLYPIFFD